MRYLFEYHTPMPPTSAPTPCRYIGCSRVVSTPGYCEQHQREHSKAMDERYKHSKEHDRLYGSRWRNMRGDYLRAHPMCVRCEQEGRQTLATVVDHVIPHKGDMRMFHDPDNWQPLCAMHHNQKSAKEDGGWGNATRSLR